MTEVQFQNLAVGDRVIYLEGGYKGRVEAKDEYGKWVRFGDGEQGLISPRNLDEYEPDSVKAWDKVRRPQS